MLGLTNVAALALLAFMFQQLSRQGMPDGVQWALLYVAAVMAPSWWTYQHYVEFARMGVQMQPLANHKRIPGGI